MNQKNDVFNVILKYCRISYYFINNINFMILNIFVMYITNEVVENLNIYFYFYHTRINMKGENI